MENTDKKVQQKISELKDEDLPFDGANLWNRLEEKLDKKEPKIVFVNWQRWAAAACILLFSGIGFVVFKSKDKEKLAINQPENHLPKIAQRIDNKGVTKEIPLEKSTILKQEIAKIRVGKESKNREHFAEKVNLKNEILAQKPTEEIVAKNEILPPPESIKIKEIQAKNVSMNIKEVVIQTPIISNKEIEIAEKPRRRLAFSIRIFPSLITSETTHSAVAAYEENSNQVKIKF